MLKTNQIRKKKKRKKATQQQRPRTNVLFQLHKKEKHNTPNIPYLSISKNCKIIFFPLKNEVACNDNMKPCTMLVRFL